MTASRSDALVLFGVTGDLAHKMIFPALYAMAKRGALEVPVIGVAFPKWSLARLRKRVYEETGSDLNLSLFDARSQSVADVLRAADTATFTFGTRLLLVTGAASWKAAARAHVEAHSSAIDLAVAEADVLDAAGDAGLDLLRRKRPIRRQGRFQPVLPVRLGRHLAG